MDGHLTSYLRRLSQFSRRMVEKDLRERDLTRMRIVPFALGLVVAIMTVGGSGARTASMDLEARPSIKPVASLASDSSVRSEGSLSETALTPEGGTVLGAAMLAAESTQEAVVDGSQAEVPNAHIPTAVVLVSCALVALATLGRRRKTHTS